MSRVVAQILLAFLNFKETLLYIESDSIVEAMNGLYTN